MIALAPREAYRLWAPTYATETAISFIEDELARELSPSSDGKRLLAEDRQRAVAHGAGADAAAGLSQAQFVGKAEPIRRRTSGDDHGVRANGFALGRLQLEWLRREVAFDDVIASPGGIPLIENGVIIGGIGVSGGTDSQDEVVSEAGAAVINQGPARIK